MTKIDSNWLPGPQKEEAISPHLYELWETVTALLKETSSDLNRIKKALIDLLSFLCSEEGRTDENFKATDFYFLLHEEHGFDWTHLPESFQLILHDIGGQLHDTISAPHIAENFKSTPEQLLERLRNLSIENG